MQGVNLSWLLPESDRHIKKLRYSQEFCASTVPLLMRIAKGDQLTSRCDSFGRERWLNPAPALMNLHSHPLGTMAPSYES